MTAHQRLRVTDGITLIALALLSAALLVVSLPSPDIGWLGWGALVPILLAIQGLSPGRAAALGLLTGVLASFGMYGWLFEVSSFDLRHAVLRPTPPMPRPRRCGSSSRAGAATAAAPS